MSERESFFVECLRDAFEDLMKADAEAFRTKFRKMAAEPFAFYRGSACVFYTDVARREDRWADERTSRFWIQGDLHAENFGTYMDGTRVAVGTVVDPPADAGTHDRDRRLRPAFPRCSRFAAGQGQGTQEGRKGF